MSTTLLASLWDWEYKPEDLTAVEMLVLVYLHDHAEQGTGIVFELDDFQAARFACLDEDKLVDIMLKLAKRNLIGVYSCEDWQIFTVTHLGSVKTEDIYFPQTMEVPGLKGKIFTRR